MQGNLDKNPWGKHDKKGFIPFDQGTPFRCPHCNNLMAADFADEKQCPNCKKEWPRNAQWRDMFVEAQQVKAHGGWSKEKLELLNGHKSSIVAPDGSVRELGEVARKMAALKVQQERRMARIRAQSRILQQTRFKGGRKVA